MIIEEIERTPQHIVEGFRDLLKYDSLTCALSDSMGRFNAMTSEMKPLFPGIRVVGTAITVKTLASDIAAVFKAIDLCKPGDIVVIDSNSSINTAFWGENITMSAINRGAIAAVIDGGCRDVEEIRKLKFPVICKGIVPNVGSVSGYGNVNTMVQCSGVSVSPGDVIAIDGNGVVVVPKNEAADILEKTRNLFKTEHIVQKQIEAGATIGELVKVDELFKNVFSYQNRAIKKNEES